MEKKEKQSFDEKRKGEILSPLSGVKDYFVDKFSNGEKPLKKLAEKISSLVEKGLGPIVAKVTDNTADVNNFLTENDIEKLANNNLNDIDLYLPKADQYFSGIAEALKSKFPKKMNQIPDTLLYGIDNHLNYVNDNLSELYDKQKDLKLLENTQNVLKR